MDNKAFSIIIENEEYDFESGQVTGGGLASILIGVSEKSGKRVILKASRGEAADEVKILSTLRRLEEVKVATVEILPALIPEKVQELYPGYRIHIEEFALGENLEKIYLEKGLDSISEKDRLTIALITAKLFKAVNRQGYAYLDHKPTDHIFWDENTKAIRVIDWNATRTNATKEEIQNDFKYFCQKLPHILNIDASITETGVNSFRFDYDLHPLFWRFEIDHLSEQNIRMSYGLWTLLSYATLLDAYQNWDELIADIESVLKTGRISSALERIKINEPQLSDDCELIERLQSKNAESIDRKDIDDALERSRKALRLGSAWSRNSNAYSKALLAYTVAFLLAPYDYRAYLAYKLLKLLVRVNGVGAEVVEKISSELNVEAVNWKVVYENLKDFDKYLKEENKQEFAYCSELTLSQVYRADADKAEEIGERLKLLQQSLDHDRKNYSLQRLVKRAKQEQINHEKIENALRSIEQEIEQGNEEGLKKADGFFESMVGIPVLNKAQMQKLSYLRAKTTQLRKELGSLAIVRTNFLEAVEAWDPAVITQARNRIHAEIPSLLKQKKILTEFVEILSSRISNISDAQTKLRDIEGSSNKKQLDALLEINAKLPGYPNIAERIKQLRLESISSELNKRISNSVSVNTLLKNWAAINKLSIELLELDENESKVWQSALADRKLKLEECIKTLFHDSLNELDSEPIEQIANAHNNNPITNFSPDEDAELISSLDAFINSGDFAKLEKVVKAIISRAWFQQESALGQKVFSAKSTLELSNILEQTKHFPELNTLNDCYHALEKLQNGAQEKLRKELTNQLRVIPTDNERLLDYPNLVSLLPEPDATKLKYEIESKKLVNSRPSLWIDKASELLSKAERDRHHGVWIDKLRKSFELERTSSSISIPTSETRQSISEERFEPKNQSSDSVTQNDQINTGHEHGSRQPFLSAINPKNLYWAGGIFVVFGLLVMGFLFRGQLTGMITNLLSSASVLIVRQTNEPISSEIPVTTSVASIPKSTETPIASVSLTPSFTATYTPTPTAAPGTVPLILEGPQTGSQSIQIFLELPSGFSPRPDGVLYIYAGNRLILQKLQDLNGYIEAWVPVMVDPSTIIDGQVQPSLDPFRFYSQEPVLPDTRPTTMGYLDKTPQTLELRSINPTLDNKYLNAEIKFWLKITE